MIRKRTFKPTKSIMKARLKVKVRPVSSSSGRYQAWMPEISSVAKATAKRMSRASSTRLRSRRLW